MTAVWVSIGFVGGLIIGALWREAFELIRGKDDPMDLLRRLRGSGITWLTLALTVSMLFTGAVGVAVFVNNGRQDEIVRCQSEYNRIVGEARDERDGYVRRNTELELNLWTKILDQSQTPQGLDQSSVEVIREYVAGLRNAQVTRAQNPYPSPDYCETPR